MKFLTFFIIFILFLQFDVFAVTEEYNRTPRAPQFWDLNESASTGDNHLSNQRSSNQHDRIQSFNEPSPLISSSEESVNDRKIQRKRKQRHDESDFEISSQQIHKKPSTSDSSPSQINKNSIQQQQINRRKSRRTNRSRINYAHLDSSSSSPKLEGEINTTKVANKNEAKPQSSTIKRLSHTTCKIHRPTCDHWFELNRNERRNETKRWNRLHFTSTDRNIENTKRRQKYSNSKIIRERLSKKSKERVARMSEKEKKAHLLKKAIVMRRSRKNKKLREQEKQVE